MDILSTILYILIFIVCLSVLVVVHELGHLTAAKIFNVYCNEFSIGFGPKIFSIKRRFGETYFSMRCIPFGGYVSMYEEGMEIPGDKEIPAHRSFSGTKKWKRAIILFAGVAMNALLALTVFFATELAFPKKDISASNVTVAENTVAHLAGLTSTDRIYISQTNLEYVYEVDKEGVITFDNDETKNVYVVLDGTNILGYDKLSWGYYLHFCVPDEDGTISFDKEITPASNIKNVSFKISEVEYKEDVEEWGLSGKTWDIVLKCGKRGIVGEDDNYKFEDLGLYFTTFEHYNENFGVTIKNTFSNFGDASLAIVKGFVSMFTTREGFKSAGGLIAIANETTSILKNYGWATFLKSWGLISVNLAIVNLFPFPGLDGWQLLVLLVESIAHKEIPTKIKSILSIIGIVLLFLFMILLLVKDSFMYIF